MGYRAICRLWEDIRIRRVADWPDGKAFEYLILRAFQLEGANVEWPFEVRLLNEETAEQVDGAIYLHALSCLVESKDHKEKISPDPIQKLRSQLLRRPAGTLGIVFATSEFTDAAVTVAHFTPPQMVLLWNGGQIEYCLRRRSMCEGLVLKYRYAVERGDPDFDPRGSTELQS